MPLSPKVRHGLLIAAFFALLIGIGLAGRHGEPAEVFLLVAVGALMLLWAHQWRSAALVGDIPRARSLRIADGEIVPRHDATPAELKRLGEAIVGWWQALPHGPDERARWLDERAVSDLLAGELPQPFALRLLAEVNQPGPGPGPMWPLPGSGRMTVAEVCRALERARQQSPHLARILPRPDARSVPFRLGAPDPAGPARVRDSLRRALPAALVEDVFVDGRSWDAEV